MNQKDFDEILNDSFAAPIVDDKTVNEMVIDKPKPAVVTVVESATPAPDVDKDFNTAKSRIRDAMDIAKESAEHLIELAKESNSAQAFDVLTKTIDSMVKGGQALVKLHKDLKEIKEETPGGNGDTTPTTLNQQNNFFVGSTEQLSQLIRDTKK